MRILFFSRLKPYFLVAKFVGLNDYPHMLLEGHVNNFKKYWAPLFGALSVATSVYAVSSLLNPSMLPVMFVPRASNIRNGSLEYVRDLDFAID